MKQLNRILAVLVVIGALAVAGFALLVYGLNAAMPVTVGAAFDAGRVTVATTATVIWRAPARGGTVLICNRHTESIYIGPASVTTANGFEVAAGDCTSQTPFPRDTIYGIVAAATARVDYAAGSFPR